MRPKGKPNPELYKVRKASLALLEQQSQLGMIDLYYGDESQVSETGYVPYGWQFEDEDVFIEVAKGKSLNCFAMITRASKLIFSTTSDSITSNYIRNQLDEFSFEIRKTTVVVLDNARIHTARKIKERLRYWQQRGLYIFYLPPYSPHLNICERLWKELKARWIKPKDYQSSDSLFYAVQLVLNAVGKDLLINFSDYRV